MTKEEFPRLLKEYRLKIGLSQKALAAKLGISSSSTIGRYERGEAAPIPEIRKKLICELGCDPHLIPTDNRLSPYDEAPFTEEERQFAEKHHGLVYSYLRDNKLSYDDWYEIIIPGYLMAVRRWFIRPDLHRFSFATIAYRRMSHCVWWENERRARQPRIVSIDEVIPNTDGLTYGNMLCDPRDCVRT